MKHYKMHKEESDHFVMHDARDGKSFKVAKKGLSDAHQQKVRKMAGGGMVGPPALEEPMLQNAFPIENVPGPLPPPAPFDFGMSNPNMHPQAPGVMPDMVASNPNMQPVTQPDFSKPPPIGGTPTNNPNTAPLGGGMQTASYSGAMPSDPMADATKQNAAVIGDYQRALDEGVKAQRDAGEAQAKIIEANALQQQKDEALYQKNHAALDQQTQALTDDVANAKIDPTRLWSGASTGNKVLASIGILLSGIGSGMAGGQNLAMNVIQKAIDNDIEAQKSELGKKQNLLTQNYRRYGDLEIARAATASQLNAAAQGQIAAAAARAQGPAAAAAAHQALAGLRAQNAQNLQIVAAQQTKNEILNSGGGPGLTPALAEQVAPKRWLHTPMGIQIAKTEEDAKVLTDGQTQASSINKQLDDMITFARTEGTTLPGTKKNAIAQSMATSLKLALKGPAVYNLGAISKEDGKMLDEVVSDPGSIFTDRSIAVLMEQKKRLKDGMANQYSSRLMNPGRLGGVQNRDVPVPGAAMSLTSGKR